MLNTDTYTIAGGDVSSDWIDAACLPPGSGKLCERRFDNTPSGHRQLIKWLLKHAHPVRIPIEASGIYSLDLALALHAGPTISNSWLLT